jgi:hypothetical protein
VIIIAQPLTTMPKGVEISEQLRKTVVHMSAVFKPEEICAFTTVSVCQQSWIMKLWRETGEVIKPLQV